MKREKIESGINFEVGGEKELRQVGRAFEILDDAWQYFEDKSRCFMIHSSRLGQMEGLTLAHWSLVTDCLRTTDMLKHAVNVNAAGAIRSLELSLCRFYGSSGWFRIQNALLREFRKNVLSAMPSSDFRSRMKGCATSTIISSVRRSTFIANSPAFVSGWFRHTNSSRTQRRTQA